MVSVAFWSVVPAVTAGVWSFGSLIVTRLFLGLGEAPCFPAGHRAICEWAPARERGFASTVFTSGILAGVAFGSLASGWLVTTVGWRYCFLVFGGVGLAWVVAWILWFRDPSQAKWLGKAEREHILATREFEETRTRAQGKASIRVLLSSASMWGLIITQVCGNYTNVFFLTWLPSYLSRAHHISILNSGLDTALCYGIACVGTILLGVLSDKILVRFGQPRAGRRYIVAFLLLGSVVMAFAPYTNSHVVLFALLTIALTCMQSSLANNQALTSDLLGDGQAIGTAIGLLFVFANIVAIVAPVLTGFLVAWTGNFIAAFEAAASLTVIGALAALVLARRPIQTRRSPEEIRTQPSMPRPAA